MAALKSSLTLVVPEEAAAASSSGDLATRRAPGDAAGMRQAPQQQINAVTDVIQRLLAERQPEGADVVQRVVADPSGLYRCFVRVSDGDADAAAELVLKYASWCAAGLGPSDDLQPLASPDGAPLVDVLDDPSAAGPAIAVVRDVRVLGLLLDDYALEAIVCSHVAKLERLLLKSVAARRHGIAIVQDLREFDLQLAKRMLDPRRLLVQSRVARFLLGAFPCRFGPIILVDAPAAFGGLWKAARKFFPSEFADAVKFLYRPEAEAQLEAILGKQVQVLAVADAELGVD